MQIIKAYGLGKKYGIPINFNGTPFIGELTGQKLKIQREIGELIKSDKKCQAPWKRVVIDTDGRMRICYFHDNLRQTIGNLHKPLWKNTHLYHLRYRSFEEGWNGKEAVSIRREFLTSGIAGRCITKNHCIFRNRI
jgi:hypothetical protein